MTGSPSDPRNEIEEQHVPVPRMGFRARLHEVIFEADTPLGKAFDIGLLVSILLSVVAVMLESVREIRTTYGSQLRTVEWFFTILFSVEYLLRLFSVGKPWRYVTSFYGIVDLLAVLPTYLSLFIPGSQTLIVIRGLRLLRIFRVLKLARYVRESRLLYQALKASSRKIAVFLWTILSLVLVVGAVMYLVEGERHGFTSIPRSIYWAIVTMTTVGYGDITPQTNLGRLIASFVMITGYGIIAIPTGIVTVELANTFRQVVSTQACPDCGNEGHDPDAKHCKYCGAEL